MNYETAQEIEVAIAFYFDFRKYVIVPNVTSYVIWGRECDLILLNSSNYAYEVEIKISKSDLTRDKKKLHNHESPKLRKLWFAMPQKLENCLDLVPEKAGILLINKTGNVTEVRKPIPNRLARKLNERERFNLARLGAMRIWPIKHKEYKQ